MPSGFQSKQDPALSYRARKIVDDRATELWVVPVTERVARTCAGLLFDAHDEYRLWWAPPDVIAFERRLELGVAIHLASESNVREVLKLSEAIEVTRFEALPSTWSDCVM